ncbi:MAG: tetratricopeptide repeat protein [Bacteroidetes bacterium]|nr:tetratricopeptide repeat protein [Bacteroidota bacterium]
MTFVLYGNTLNHNFVLDDDIFNGKNSYVQEGLQGTGKILTTSLYHGFNRENEGAYRPLVLINFAVEKQFFKGTAKTGHFFNVLFYALCGILLFRFLNLLFRNHPGNVYLSLAITAIWLAHPVHTEVVANIKSRDEILSFIFSILTFHYLLVFSQNAKLLPLAISILSYFLTLLSKEYGLTFIALIPLFLWFFSPGLPVKKIILFTIPFIAIALIYFIIRSSILENIAFKDKMDIINNALAAAENRSDRLATAVKILGHYLKLLFWPHPLSFDYSYNQIPVTGWLNPATLLSLFCYGAIGIFSLRGIKRRNPAAFGILFYLITLSIVSNIFVEIGSTLGERFLFTPSLGFCIAVTILLWNIMGKVKTTSVKNVFPFTIVMLILILASSAKTVSRNRDWKNNLALFSADVHACPNSARAHFSLASEFKDAAKAAVKPDERQKLFEQAEKEFFRSVEIYPGFWSSWYNLGVTYYEFGLYDKALDAYIKAIGVRENYPEALSNAGVIYFNRKEFDKALDYFRKAVKCNPSFADACANMGAVYHNKGVYDSARVWYNKALQLDPNNVNVRNNMKKLPGNP